MHTEVKVFLHEGSYLYPEVEGVVPSTKGFPYWTLSLPDEEDGRSRIVFFNHHTVKCVEITGPRESEEEEAPKNNLTVLRGGEEDDAVS